MSRHFFLSALLVFVISLSLSAQEVIKKGKSLYLANIIVVKVKNSTTSAQLNETLSKFSVNNVKEIFPSKGTANKITGLNVLNGIYLVNYNTKEDPTEFSAKVAKMPGVLWAEPKYVRKVCYAPNDSLFINGKQDDLAQINADDAWNITKGNKKIIIAIVDVGVDWRHPDLLSNIYMKNDSLIPGSDLGGLLGTPDNDPSEDVIPGGEYHGTLVAGIADAVTDNGIGIASIGYNCKILPVKVSRSNIRDVKGMPYIFYGSQGIKWAVDHGAKIINCSWGGYTFSKYEKSIIDYAIAKGAVIVAAEGNSSSTENFYPADYPGVLSVGWLKTGVGVKTIALGANYGENVKVFAPGSNIYSTQQRLIPSSPGTYNTGTGSSMAAPLVSGLAGLVWSEFPYYTPMQVEERIRVTSDFIDEYNGSSYNHLLGHGVINAFHAVDPDFKAISVRADSIHFIDLTNGDTTFNSGDNVSIEMNFTNYLAKINNVTVTLTTQDNYVTIENSTFETGPMDTLTVISNKLNAFKFKITKGVPYNHTIHFLFKYSNSSGYTDFQWMDLTVNKVDGPLYVTNKTRLIKLTVTATGNLAFYNYPVNTEGEGFKYKNSENLMNEGAFMYGTGSNRVMDAARITNQQSKDFSLIKPIETFPDYSTNKWTNSVFSDSGAGRNALGIETNMETYQSGDNNYIILDCTLTNTSNQNISGLYVGYYIDWDIPESDRSHDTTYFDNINKIAIAYNTKDPNVPITGIALISSNQNFGYYPIDNSAKSGNIVLNDKNGFSDAEKWYGLSHGVLDSLIEAGNISYIISGGPYSIWPKGGQIDVKFSIAAGSTQQVVIDSIKESRLKYGVSLEHKKKTFTSQLNQNYPNPFNPTTTISYSLAEGGNVTLKVYDILGRKVATLVHKHQLMGNYKVQFSAKTHQLSSGVYFYRLTVGNFSTARKMILLK